MKLNQKNYCEPMELADSKLELCPLTIGDIEQINKTIAELNITLKTLGDSCEYRTESDPNDPREEIKLRILALSKIVQIYYTRTATVPAQFVLP